MRHGVVLPFTAQQRLTRDDHAGLQRIAAAFPEAQIDILISRDRREIAILALAGRHVWIRREGTSLQARDASSGRLLAEASCIGDLLASVEHALLPDGTPARARGGEFPHSTPPDQSPAGE
ncbi:hypothetical protein [Roseicella aerolata]|uniref:Uncharacterized protein n=1 Tax=Roseicella aerolata TaxID=2883479 RepID=A0A9X1IBD2_9PROT|nr:hypothetical protein [Roseicella aerolata]MCB4820243.1 hypothetical protein [Roseicella aerolata]